MTRLPYSYKFKEFYICISNCILRIPDSLTSNRNIFIYNRKEKNTNDFGVPYVGSLTYIKEKGKELYRFGT